MILYWKGGLQKDWINGVSGKSASESWDFIADISKYVMNHHENIGVVYVGFVDVERSGKCEGVIG